MPPRLASGPILFALLILTLPSMLFAQSMGTPVEGKDYELFEFDSGENYRVRVRGLFDDPDNGQRIYFFPDQRLDCNLYMRNAYDEPGWAYWFADQGWIAFSSDLPASGSSPPASNDDLVQLTEHAIESIYRSTSAVFPSVVCAQGLGAAFAIKLRSTTPDNIPAAILIDPWGVRDVNPRTEMTADELLQREATLEEHLWVEWGLGPAPGELHENADLDEEGFEMLMKLYDLKAPPYWATVSTGLQSWMQILNPMHMAEWPVLVVRGAHPTPEMDARREAVTTWLEENGAYVEYLDLAQEGPAGISNLPMAGHQAGAVAELLFEWCQNLPPNPKFPNQPSTP